MLGALTSLTGGGGMSASSSATNGDFGSDSNYQVGNMNFGSASGMDNQQTMIIGAVVVVGLYLWLKK